MLSIQFGVFFGILGISFIFLAWLVLKQTRKKTNSIFGLGIIGFSISAFICSLSFFEILPSSAGIIGNTVMLWAPVGILFAGKIILYGDEDWRSMASLRFLGIYGVLTLGFLVWGISNIKLPDALILSSLGVAVILGYSIVKYLQIYQIAPAARNQLRFLVIGKILAVLGLIIAILAVSENVSFVSADVQPFGGILINLGILIAGIAFTGIPNKIQIRSKETPAGGPS